MFGARHRQGSCRMFFVAMSLEELTVMSAFLAGYASQDFLNTRGMKSKDYHNSPAPVVEEQPIVTEAQPPKGEEL